MSSVICFNLDQSKIFSSGNGLNTMHSINYLNMAITCISSIILDTSPSNFQVKLTDIPAHQYVRTQFKNHKITTEILCKSKHEVNYVAETYLCMLQSVKKYEVNDMYYYGRPLLQAWLLPDLTHSHTMTPFDAPGKQAF